MKLIRNTFIGICKWGTLVLCAVLVLQALPLSPLFSAGATAPDQQSGVREDQREAELLAAINQQREQAGKAPLSLLPALSRAATTRAKELATAFSHTRPNGQAGFTVLDEHQRPYGSAAENLAAGDHSASDVLTAWMGSDGHRANILGAYSHVGIGYTPSGVNGGSGWVLLFVGGCTPHSLSVTGSTSLPLGTAISDAKLTLHATCATHGVATLPLTDKLCTGYDKDTYGTQTVTVSYGHATHALVLRVGTAADAPRPAFTDVPSGAWYADAVYTLVEQGILSGTSDTTFSPNGTLTRAMLVTMLGRMAGMDPTAYTKSDFTDVKVGEWYAPYVQWAYERGIATGYGNGLFAPNTSITREQLCVFLIRYAGATGTPLPTTGGDGFTDAARISSWAKSAVSIAARARLVNGYSDGSFRPQTTATRAEAAAILAKFLALTEA